MKANVTFSARMVVIMYRESPTLKWKYTKLTTNNKATGYSTRVWNYSGCQKFLAKIYFLLCCRDEKFSKLKACHINVTRILQFMQYDIKKFAILRIFEIQKEKLPSNNVEKEIFATRVNLELVWSSI